MTLKIWMLCSRVERADNRWGDVISICYINFDMNFKTTDIM